MPICFVARHHRHAGFGRKRIGCDRHDALARAAAMLDARHHFLPDIAALGEVDAVELVHVGLVREGIAVNEIEPAARHAERDAMRFVGAWPRPVPRRDRPPLPAPDAAAASRACPAPAAAGRDSISPYSVVPAPSQIASTPSVAERSSSSHLGAQLVEVELSHQIARERARTIEKKAAAVLRRRFRDDAIDDDLALRREQGGKARSSRRHLADIGGQAAH